MPIFSESKLNWQTIYVVLLGVLLLCIGQDNSFIAFSFHGLCWRIMTLACLMIWVLVGKDRQTWGVIWSYPIWWVWCLVLVFQTLVSWQALTPGFALNFLEGRLWISIVLMLLVDALQVPGARVLFKRALGACFVFGVLYGFYQVWIALPELRASVAGSLEMSSELHEERFMLRLNSDEMFGSRLYANLFGLFACVGFFSLLPKVGDRSDPYRIVLKAIMFLALIYSGSKGAILVGFCVGAVYVFWILKRKYQLPLSYLLLSPVLVGVVLFLVREQLQASVQIRLDYWYVAFQMLLENPLGIGALNFSEHYGMYMHPEATEVNMAHNDHLQFFCEFGFIGGLLNLIFFIYLVVKSFRNMRIENKISLGVLNHSFIYISFGLFALYLLITCLGISMGPWDLPLHGFSWIFITFLIVLWIMQKSKCFDKVTWSLWGILLMILHAFIDMPLYDHGLLCIILAAFFCESSTPNSEFHLNKVFKVVMTVSFILFSIFGIKRYQHLLISDWMGMQEKWDKESLLEQVSKYRFDHQTLEPIYRNWNRLGRPQLGVGEADFLPSLLRTRPLNSDFALNYAKQLDPEPEAEVWYEKAYRHRPQQPRYAYHLGEYLLRQGRDADGKKWLNLALERHKEADELSKSNDDFLLHLLQTEQLQNASELIKN